MSDPVNKPPNDEKYWRAYIDGDADVDMFETLCRMLDSDAERQEKRIAELEARVTALAPGMGRAPSRRVGRVGA